MNANLIYLKLAVDKVFGFIPLYREGNLSEKFVACISGGGRGRKLRL